MYDPPVGSTRPEREEPLARTTYVAAARRYVSSFAAVIARGVPVDPGRSAHDVREWQVQDVQALQELHEALGQMLSARRAYDAVRRHR